MTLAAVINLVAAWLVLSPLVCVLIGRAIATRPAPPSFDFDATLEAVREAGDAYAVVQSDPDACWGLSPAIGRSIAAGERADRADECDGCDGEAASHTCGEWV